MSISCPHCAAQMPDSVAFCPGCGRPMQPVLRAQGRVGIFPENIAGALAYVSFVPAAIFLLVGPYQKNRFVRFHSVQCLLAWAAGVLIGLLLRFAGPILFIIPVLGHLLVWLLSMLTFLAAAVTWLVLVVKALQGEAFKLPVIGELAEHRAVSI